MKHLKYLFIALLLIIPFAISEAQTKKTVTTQPIVEVLYFHGPQRCRTCVALENATKELIDSKFSAQIKSGKVKFREIDLSTKEGEKLGDKYQVAWSSLVIVRKQGKKEKVADMTDDGFRYAVSDKAKIQALIQQKINEFMK